MARVPQRQERIFPQPIDYVLGVILAICLLVLFLMAPPASAQNRIVITPTVTSGNGELTTAISWETVPPAPGDAPCTATGLPEWAGSKAGSGMVTLSFLASATLNLQCVWPGKSIVEFTWVNATTNVDNSPYTDSATTRIKYTFAPSLTAGADCGAGETCVDIPDPQAARPTMRTITGITQTGDMRARAFHINQRGVASDPSNAVVTSFTGLVTVTESVGITINPKPGAPSNFAGL